VRDIVRERITADVGVDALLAFTAHMALRQVDWAIRHHSPTATRRWVEVADDWLIWAAR